MTGALVSGLAQGAVFALLAIGIVLVFKGSRVLNLAQGEIGALAFLSSVALLGHTNANGLFVLLLSMVLGAVIGIVVERTMMRPLVERPAVQGTIVTLGLAIAIIQFELIADSWFLPPDSVSYPVQVATLNTAGSFSLEIGGAALAAGRVVALIATAIIATALYLFFTRTKFGLGVVAATSNNEVARILGIPVSKVYRFTWGVGGALAGLSAALIAPVLGSFAPFVMTSRRRARPTLSAGGSGGARDVASRSLLPDLTRAHRSDRRG